MITQVARLTRRAFDERARKLGMTRPQWHALNLLLRHPGINQGGLAELLEVEPITLGRMIDRMQEAGLVVRRADPADRRAWRLHATAKGEALAHDLRPHAEVTLDLMMAGFSPEERASLMDMLGRLGTNLARRPRDDS